MRTTREGDKDDYDNEIVSILCSARVAEKRDSRRFFFLRVLAKMS